MVLGGKSEQWSDGVIDYWTANSETHHSTTPLLHSSVLLSFPDLPIAENDKFRRRELFEAHGAEGVNFTRADADFGAQSELAAVVKARRCVHHHGGGVDAVDERSRPLIVLRHDGFRVFRPVALDMIDGFIHVGDDPHG